MNKAKLEDILEALEFSNEEGNYYYNKIIEAAYCNDFCLRK